MNYYLWINEEQVGPYQQDQLIEMLQTGEVTPVQLVWAEGFEDWKPLSEVFEIEVESKQSESSVSSLQNSLSDHTPIVDLPAYHNFLSDDQNPKLVEKVYQRLMELCTSEETISYIAVQKKPLVNIAPDAVALTNRRLIIFRSQIIGMNFADYLWMNIANVHLSEQMFTSTFSITVVGGKKTFVDSLPKKQARKLYSIAQEMEETVMIARRHRELEDKRAAAGGVVVHSPIGTPPSIPTSSSSEDTIVVLGKIKKLLDQGLITQEDYDKKKNEVMNRL